MFPPYVREHASVPILTGKQRKDFPVGDLTGTQGQVHTATKPQTRGLHNTKFDLLQMSPACAREQV